MPLAIALVRGRGSVSVYRTAILPRQGANVEWNGRYAERLLKFLLWQKGGWCVMVSGDPALADYLGAVHSPTGARAFDRQFMGERVFGRPLTVESVASDAIPDERETTAPLGRQLEAEFPDLAEPIRFHIPGEREKRHGQAIAAASLPAIAHTEVPNVP